MKAGDIVIVNEPPRKHDSNDFRGELGEVLYKEYECFAVEVGNIIVFCDPSNLIKAEAAPQMYEALKHIAFGGCRNYIGTDCATEGRDKQSKCSAENWCDACVAQSALDAALEASL